MNFNDYQKESRKYVAYPDVDENIVYPVLGICGESGEISDKVKKVFREKQGVFDEQTKKEIAKEIGDVLWYLAQLASELGISFQDIAEGNIEKIKSRNERGVMFGNGDNR